MRHSAKQMDAAVSAVARLSFVEKFADMPGDGGETVLLRGLNQVCGHASDGLAGNFLP